MARVNTSLIWSTIGDIYQKIFVDDQKRPIEAMWQAASDLASDVLQRTYELKRARGIFTTDWRSWWGTQYVEFLYAERSIRAIALSAYEINGEYRLLVQVPSGTIASGLSDLIWFDGQLQRWFFYEKINARLWSIRLESEAIHKNDLRSFEFVSTSSVEGVALGGSRPMVKTTDGLSFNVEGLNLSLLTVEQTVQASGRYFEVDLIINQFVPGNTTSIKRIAMSLIGVSSAVSIEFEYKNDPAFYLRVGSVATPISIRVGSLNTLKTQLLNASSAQPVRIKIKAEIDEVSREISASVIAGEVITSAISVAWVPQPTIVYVDVFDQLGSISGLVERILIIDDPIELRLQEGVGYRYTTMPPIVGADRIMGSPFRLGARCNIESVAFGVVTLEIDEDTVWLPSDAILDTGVQTYQVKHIDRYQDQARYELVLVGEGVPDLGPCMIEPWYARQFEGEFEAPGVYRSRRRLPSERLWVRGARATDLNLFERWAKWLGLGKADDSKKYLQEIKGMWAGIHQNPTSHGLEGAVAQLLGVDLSVEGGVYNSSTIIRDELGAPLSIEATVGRERIQISYALRDSLKTIGSTIAPWGQIIKGVEIFDLYNNPDAIQEIQKNIWARPHTIGVKIPSQIGVSLRTFELLKELISRSKPHHTLGYIQMSTQDEGIERWDNEDGSRQASHRESGWGGGFPYASEDTIFPDHWEVLNDDLGPSLEDGDEQVISAPEMESRLMNFEGLVLGQWPVTFLRHTYQVLGKQLGSSYPVNDLIRAKQIDHPWYADDPKGSVTSEEASLGFSRTPMRIPTSHERRQPVSLVRLLDDLNTELVYTDGDWLVSGVAVGDFFDLWMVSAWEAYIVGESGASSVILRTTDYGSTWSLVTAPSITGPWLSVDNGWACGDGGACAERINATTWAAVTVDATNHDYKAISNKNGLLVVAGEDVTSGGDAKLFTSTNGGVSFTDLTPGGALTFFGVETDGVNIWAASDDGTWESNDQGASWRDDNLSTIFYAVARHQNRVWWGGAGTFGYTLIGNLDTIQAVSLPTMIGSDSIFSINFDQYGFGMVISRPDGKIWITKDHGETWSLEAVLGADVMRGDLISKNFRMITGTNDFQMRWKG